MRFKKYICKIIILTLLIGILISTGTKNVEADVSFDNLETLSNQDLLKSVKIYQTNTVELGLLLDELQRRFPNKDDRLKAIAEMYLGAEYYTEPFINELEDPLPYQRTNCTMFVIYATTMVNSSNYQEALEKVKQVHYRGGIVGYKSRYHFTTDRITDPENHYFSVVTDSYAADPAALWEVSVNLNVRTSGNYLLKNLDGWNKPITVKYIKRDNFTIDKLKFLPRTLGVAFVKKSNWKLGVVVGHEGILIDGDLYHSGSPTTGLYKIDNYFIEKFAKSNWEGVIFFTINEVE